MRCDLAFAAFRASGPLAAENLVLRAQLEMCARCRHRRRRIPDARKIVIALATRSFDLRGSLVLVTPATVRRWERSLTRLLWRIRSRRHGRPPLAADAVAVIQKLARENPTWSVRRIASVASVSLAIRVSAATVRKYLPLDDPRRRRRSRASSERWSTFIRAHAETLLACDFAIEMLAGARLVSILVVMHVATRRIVHIDLTAHPNETWMIQQFRDAIPTEHPFTHLIHDRDACFSRAVDESLRGLGIEPLRTPIRTPIANTHIERLIGTVRRECLDWLLPLTENQLRHALRDWAAYYNRGRPHLSLGPGVPEPTPGMPAPKRADRHTLPPGARIESTPVLGGLHHDYRLVA